MLNSQKVDQGLVSSWLVEKSQVGDILRLGQPYGDMQQSIQTPKLLLLVAGSGITPMLSLIESLSRPSNWNKHLYNPSVLGQNSSGRTDYLKKIPENLSKFQLSDFLYPRT